MKSVGVFCGSSSGASASYEEVARVTGDALARADLRLINGGGRVGLMGVLADAVLSAGGQVTGVMPRALLEREIAHQGLSDLRIVESMHQRKELMASLADGFMACPVAQAVVRKNSRVVKKRERLEIAWLRILHRLRFRMGFSDAETSPTISLSRSYQRLEKMIQIGRFAPSNGKTQTSETRTIGEFLVRMPTLSV